MPDSVGSVQERANLAQRLKQWLVPAIILLMAAAWFF